MNFIWTLFSIVLLSIVIVALERWSADDEHVVPIAAPADEPLLPGNPCTEEEWTACKAECAEGGGCICCNTFTAEDDTVALYNGPDWVTTVTTEVRISPSTPVDRVVVERGCELIVEDVTEMGTTYTAKCQ